MDKTCEKCQMELGENAGACGIHHEACCDCSTETPAADAPVMEGMEETAPEAPSTEDAMESSEEMGEEM